MNIFWLEQTEADLPATNDWLSRTEAELLSAMRFPKRRADWRLGRWTAKRALSICLGLDFDYATAASIEILAARSGQPEAFVRGRLSPVSISLSHREGAALCTVGQAGIPLGCDLEVVESHGDAFIADYFTAEEQALLSGIAVRDRPVWVSLLWSAKESALKALHEGLRADPRAANVYLDVSQTYSDSWLPVEVRYAGGITFHGCWSRNGDVIRTIVAGTPSLRPISLHPTSKSVSGLFAEIFV